MPNSQIIKPDANGKATRWQGYVAREGLGITRTRNQTSAAKPVRGNNHQSHLCLPVDGMTLPVLEQRLIWCLFFRNDIILFGAYYDDLVPPPRCTKKTAGRRINVNIA